MAYLMVPKIIDLYKRRDAVDVRIDLLAFHSQCMTMCDMMP